MSSASVSISGLAEGSKGAELEPLGMDAGAFHLIAPPPPTYRPPLKEARSYPGFADMLLGSQCRVDGIDMPCGMAGGEATFQCPNNDCGPRAARDSTGHAVGIVVFDLNAYLDNRGVGGNAGFIPAGSTYTGNGNFVGGTFQGGESVAVQLGFWEGGLPSGGGISRLDSLNHGPTQQNPTPTPQTSSQQTPEYCLPKFIEAMKTAWFQTSDGMNGSEAGFAGIRQSDGKGGTYPSTRDLPFTNQKKNDQGRENLSFKWSSIYQSIWHVHPRGGPPSDIDQALAIDKKVPIYSFGPDGLYVYKPPKDKSGEATLLKLRDGLDWAQSCEKKPPPLY